MIKPKDGNYRYFISYVVGKELEEAGLWAYDCFGAYILEPFS